MKERFSAYSELEVGVEIPPCIPNKCHFGLHEFSYNPKVYVSDMDIKFPKNSSSLCMA